MYKRQAQAAQVNSINVTGASTVNGNVCQIAADVNWTADTADAFSNGFNRDYIQLGAENTAGQRFNTPSVREQPVGNSQTISQGVSLSGAQENNFLYVVRDPASNTTAAGSPNHRERANSA